MIMTGANGDETCRSVCVNIEPCLIALLSLSLCLSLSSRIRTRTNIRTLFSLANAE